VPLPAAAILVKSPAGRSRRWSAVILQFCRGSQDHFVHPAGYSPPAAKV
jgi:hypothetical protein